MRATFSNDIPLASPLESLALARIKSILHDRPVEQTAKNMRARDDVLALHTRADATVGTTGTDGWASQLIRDALRSYLTSLPDSAAAKIIQLGMTIPEGDQLGFRAPRRNTDPAPLPFVGEGEPIPVRSYGFQDLTLTPKKWAMISVISRELASRPGSEAAVRQLLREDGEVALDTAYFTDTVGDDVNHAGLLAGLSPSAAGYSGGDAYAFRMDCEAILETIGPRNSGSIVYVVGMSAAERLAAMAPWTAGKVFGSQVVSDTTLIGIDAGNLVHSFGNFSLDVSLDALVHMSDTPQEIVSSSPATADPALSLYQVGCVGVRIIGDIAFAARKDNVAGYVTGVTW